MRMHMKGLVSSVAIVAFVVGGSLPVRAQTPAPVPAAPAPAPAPRPPAAAVPVPAGTQPAASAPAPVLPQGVALPADYVIGPADVLSIVFWRDADLTHEVSVRPDGKISLPLLNEIVAAGLTPEQLRAAVTAAAANYVEQPTVHVIVKAVNSRNVYITGMVAKPGVYPLLMPTTVLQLIALAGGLHEFANGKNITIIRTENGRPTSYRFNYSDVLKRKNLQQNILLQPGDSVAVP